MKIARKIARLDPWGLMASKMSINQAADIMGYSAAIKASCNFWVLSRSRRDPKTWAEQYNVGWVKSRDKQFND
jgi:hypothetical protein